MATFIWIFFRASIFLVAQFLPLINNFFAAFLINAWMRMHNSNVNYPVGSHGVRGQPPVSPHGRPVLTGSQHNVNLLMRKKSNEC